MAISVFVRVSVSSLVFFMIPWMGLLTLKTGKARIFRKKYGWPKWEGLDLKWCRMFQNVLTCLICIFYLPLKRNTVILPNALRVCWLCLIRVAGESWKSWKPWKKPELYAPLKKQAWKTLTFICSLNYFSITQITLKNGSKFVCMRLLWLYLSPFENSIFQKFIQPWWTI